MRISDWSSDVCSFDLQVEVLALRRCLDLLGLARRAGAEVAGFEKVRAALRAGEVGLLVQAADGADDGRQKIQALARAVGPQVPLLQFCSAAELGAAVGREAADRKSTRLNSSH